jgi:hypothetical protein
MDMQDMAPSGDSPDARKETRSERMKRVWAERKANNPGWRPSRTKSAQVNEEDGLGIVWGVEAIGKIINRTPRQTHYLLSKGTIPAARRCGGLWCADKAGLRAQFCTAS